MITVTNRNTCKDAHVPETYITSMEEHLERVEERDYPFTRLHIVDPKMGHDYFLDVVESKKYIEKLIDEEKDRPKMKEDKSND